MDDAVSGFKVLDSSKPEAVSEEELRRSAEKNMLDRYKEGYHNIKDEWEKTCYALARTLHSLQRLVDANAPLDKWSDFDNEIIELRLAIEEGESTLATVMQENLIPEV